MLYKGQTMAASGVDHSGLLSWKPAASSLQLADSLQGYESRIHCPLYKKVRVLQHRSFSVTEFEEGTRISSFLPNVVLIEGNSSAAAQRPVWDVLTELLQLGFFLNNPLFPLPPFTGAGSVLLSEGSCLYLSHSPSEAFLYDKFLMNWILPCHTFLGFPKQIHHLNE